MPRFIQYHIDPLVFSLCFKHITFTSVFLSTRALLSIDFTCVHVGACRQTDQFVDRPLGAPMRPANHPICGSPQQQITPHIQWPLSNGGNNLQSAPEGPVFQGIVTYIRIRILYLWVLVCWSLTSLWATDNGHIEVVMAASRN